MINILRRWPSPEQAGRDMDIGHDALAVFLPRPLVVPFETKGEAPGETQPGVRHISRIAHGIMPEKQRRLLVLSGQQKQERDIKPRTRMVVRIGLQQSLACLGRLRGTTKVPLAEHRAKKRPQQRPRRPIGPPPDRAPPQQGALDFFDLREQTQTLFVSPGLKFHLREFDQRRGAGRIDFSCFLQSGTPFAGRTQAGHVTEQTFGQRRLRQGGHAGAVSLQAGQLGLKPCFVWGGIDQFHFRFPVTSEIFPFLRNPLRSLPDRQLVRHTEIVEVMGHPFFCFHLVQFVEDGRWGEGFEGWTNQQENGR